MSPNPTPPKSDGGNAPAAPIKKTRDALSGIKKPSKINATNSALLIAIAVYVIFGFVSSKAVRNETIETAEEHLKQELSALVASSSAEHLFDSSENETEDVMHDQKRLGEFIRDIREISILGVQAYSTDFELLPGSNTEMGATDVSSMQEALSQGPLMLQTDNPERVKLIVPIKRGGIMPAGVIVVDYDWSRTLGQVKNANDWILGGLFASALVVTIALWWSFRAFNKELRKRHRALSAILDQSPIGIYTVKRNGVIDSFNPKMVELAGVKSSSEIIGLNVFDLPSYRKTGLDKHFKKSIEEGNSFDVEVEYESQTGRKRTWRHYRGIPIFRPYSAQVDRLLLLVEDVTKQKELEKKNTEYAEQLEKWAWDRTQRLVQTKERLENVLERIPVFIWSINPDGKIAICQGSGLNNVNLKPEDLIGKTVEEALPGNQEMKKGVGQGLAGQENIFESTVNGRHLQSFVSPGEPAKDGPGMVTILTIDVTDRVQIEQKFAAMAANAPEITSLVDADGNITYITGPTMEILGYDHEELSGKHLSEMVHPDDFKRLGNKLKEVISSPEMALKETVRFRRKGGSWVHVESIAQSHLKDPAIAAIVVNSRDISDRIAAEEELKQRVETEMAMAAISETFATSDDLSASIRESLKEIGHAIHAKNVFCINVDHEGNIESVFEWTAVGSKGIADDLTDAAKSHRAWKDSLISAQSTCLPSISEIRHKETREFLQEKGVSGSLVVRPIIGSDGLVGSIGMLVEEGRDDLEVCDSQILLVAAEVISSAVQRNDAFNTARLQTKQQATVAAFGQTVITENSAKDLLEAATETVRTVLGAQVVGFYKHRPENSDFIVTAGIGWPEGAMNSESIPLGVDSQAGFTMLAKQTTVVNDYASDSRFRPSPLLKASGAKGGICVIVGDTQNPWGVFGAHFTDGRNLTDNEVGFVEAIAHLTGLGLDKINSQLRVRELDHLKSKFIQIVSHQFRTPLSAARWNLESMLSGDVGALTPEMRQFLRITHEATTEVIRRIRDLLTVMDIEERRITLNPAKVSIESMIGSVATEFQRRTDLKQIKMRTEMPDEPLPALDIDQDRIRTALEKIIENSVSYTPANGEIVINLQKSGSNAVITITDNGIGIPVAEQARIFERFYRASNANTAKPDASGLGLTIAKHFIEQHGGTIGIESTEGKGTKVEIKLPILA